MPSINEVLGEIVAAGNTTIATAGSGVPLHGIVYNEGTVSLTNGEVLAVLADRQTLTGTIASNGDDAKVFILDSSFEISPEGSMIQMGNANDGIYWGLFRWDGLLIPKGATIFSAYVTLTSTDDYMNETCRLAISADASDDSPVFDSFEDVTGRLTGAKSVSFVVPTTLSGVVYNTPNLASVIQEVIDRPGWASGNAISLFFEDDGSDAWALRGVSDFGGFPAAAAVLTIQYSEAIPAIGTPIQDLYLATAGAKLYQVKSIQTLTGLQYEKRIVGGVNDVSIAADGSFNADADHIILGSYDQPLHSMVRFTNVTMPKGATIINAYVTLTSYMDLGYLDTVKVLISADASDNSPVFVDYADVNGRSLSSASKAWDMLPPWGEGLKYNTPNLAPVIQEIIDRPGWVSGNAISLFFKDNGSGWEDIRRIRSADSFPDDAPILCIEYTLLAVELVSSALQTESSVDYTCYKMYGCCQIMITVPETNTGGVWLGRSTVDKTAQNGFYISKGQSVILDANGLINFWVDSDYDGDTISWLLLK